MKPKMFFSLKLALFVSLMALCPAAWAQSLVVTNINDSGPGSLRYVISNAPSGGTITFTSTLSSATIVLTTGPLLLNTNLAIDGSALTNSVILSGNNASGIFYVGSNAVVSLTGLTMVNGSEYDGGAVYGGSGTSVTLTRCTLSGNYAVEGGALLNDGAMVVNECTLADNFGSYGGAMQCRGGTSISQCTFSGNTGYYGGGGLWIGNVPVTVSNSIIAANSAPGGSSSNLDIEVTGGSLNYSGSNVVQFTANLAVITGPAPMTNAPLLAPLGNYGGPTQTMPPMPGSPVIDAAVSNSLTIDQRGFPRVVGPAPDLGAVEFQDASAVVTTTADSGVGSLRYAATYTTNNQVVTFDSSLAGATIRLTSGQILLKPILTIDASALPGGVRIDGNNQSRIFQVNGSNTVVLNSLTITNGNGTGGSAPNSGGGIFNGGNSNHLTLNNCWLTGNSSTNLGGGLDSAGATLVANGTTFSGNTCPLAGGVYCSDQTCTFNGCTFSGNLFGGALHMQTTKTMTATFINCTFTANSTTNAYGSVIGMTSPSQDTSFAILTNCTITGNSTVGAGFPGAIFLPSVRSVGTNSLSLYNTIISGNTTNGVEADISVSTSLDPNAMVSGTNNLLGVGVGLTNGINGNQVGVNNPQLAPLGNYGGPTQTMPPLPGSPAIDAGGATSLTTDQRGFPRPLGLATDIGAVEGIYNLAGPGKITQVTFSGNNSSSLQFGFTNYTDMIFTVLTSTNLTLPLNLWTNIGYAVESPAGSGQYQFTDPQATNYPQRFYRVRSP
jgi:hypothetical protein